MSSAQNNTYSVLVVENAFNGSCSVFRPRSIVDCWFHDFCEVSEECDDTVWPRLGTVKSSDLNNRSRTIPGPSDNSPQQIEASPGSTWGPVMKVAPRKNGRERLESKEAGNTGSLRLKGEALFKDGLVLGETADNMFRKLDALKASGQKSSPSEKREAHRVRDLSIEYMVTGLTQMIDLHPSDRRGLRLEVDLHRLPLEPALGLVDTLLDRLRSWARDGNRAVQAVVVTGAGWHSRGKRGPVLQGKVKEWLKDRRVLSDWAPNGGRVTLSVG